MREVAPHEDVARDRLRAALAPGVPPPALVPALGARRHALEREDDAPEEIVRVEQTLVAVEQVEDHALTGDVLRRGGGGGGF